MIWCERSLAQNVLLLVGICTAIYFTISLGGGPNTYLYLAFVVIAVFTKFVLMITVDIEGITIHDGLVKVNIPFFLIKHIEEKNGKLTIYYGYKEMNNTYVIRPRKLDKFTHEMLRIAPAIEIVKKGK